LKCINNKADSTLVNKDGMVSSLTEYFHDIP
jgi:hypothetical protein